MKRRFLFPVFVLFCLSALFPALVFSDVPKKIAFQGRLTDNTGVPITASSQTFTFKFYNTETGGSLISSGTITNVHIRNGLYSVILDISSISQSDMDNPLWVEVTYNNATFGARTPLTTSPYAMTVRDGSITTVKIADGNVTTAKIADNSITTDKILDGNVTLAKLSATASGSSGKYLTSNGSSLLWENVGGTLPGYTGANKFLRTNSSNTGSEWVDGVELTANKKTVIASTSTDTDYPSAGAVYRYVAYSTNTVLNGVELTVNKDTFTLTNSISSYPASSVVLSTVNALYAALSGKQDTIDFSAGLTYDSASRELSVSTPIPNYSQVPDGSVLTVSNNASSLSWSSAGVLPPTTSVQDPAYLKYDGNNNVMWANDIFSSTVTLQNQIDDLNISTYNINIATTVLQSSITDISTSVVFLTGDQTIEGEKFFTDDLTSSLTFTTRFLTVTDTSTFAGLVTAPHLVITGTSTFSTSTFHGDVNISTGAKLTIGGIDISTGEFVGSTTTPKATGLIINSNVQVEVLYASYTLVQQADLAEIYPSSDLLAPGDVVIISETRDGYIEKSKIAKDNKVAGVVSTKPGLILNSQETGYQLALVGKVPVNVTDEGGDIKRGDLLTTSSTAGYAMRAVDPKPGTIIGKALENSKGSRSKILVLVNLQ
ncbi:MAG: hypothetical protein LBQ47_04390 [Endomicrobium sp.]|jgi:hypothetical protein|nr:hypothetical protein [Endomicrobium sp.]